MLLLGAGEQVYTGSSRWEPQVQWCFAPPDKSSCAAATVCVCWGGACGAKAPACRMVTMLASALHGCTSLCYV